MNDYAEFIFNRKRFLMASGRSEKELQGVTMLGHKTDYPTDYA
ncbi:MAG: NADPH-dependent 7-cyano-7-deazaguanine reductase QueF, partial [Veillonella sp.]|nr:NADPH-dependent 7-cyano-7-deazaguanine reductase QueF [Veillonella sp.]